MALRAGIDVGTNTILLLVADVDGERGRIDRVLEDHVRVVRLGQGVDKNRAFLPEAMDRARACFREYAQTLRKYPGVEVRAVATSGSRDAVNSEDFFEEVRREAGIAVRVISGEEEAQLSFRGALPGDAADPASIAVLDIGGGSTEIVGKEERGEALFRYSFDMGCVRLSERFLLSDPPEDSQIQKLQDFVREELAKQAHIVQALKGRELVGVAGTATYLASSALGLDRFDPEKVHGASLTRDSVRSLRERFQRLPAAQRLGIGGMDRGRADVIVAGASILEEVLVAARLSGLTVSVRGLRYGAVLDY